MENKLTIFKILTILLACSLLMTGCSEDRESQGTKKVKQYSYFHPAKDDDLKDTIKHQTVYLPVYSHVYTSEDIFRRMAITVSIRNTDSKQNLIVEEISYYNTGGELVEKYLSEPNLLGPMASIDFTVDLDDMRGGSGANFIIKWASKNELSSPVIQAAMVNDGGNTAFAFITDGYNIK